MIKNEEIFYEKRLMIFFITLYILTFYKMAF